MDKRSSRQHYTRLNHKATKILSDESMSVDDEQEPSKTDSNVDSTTTNLCLNDSTIANPTSTTINNSIAIPNDCLLQHHLNQHQVNNMLYISCTSSDAHCSSLPYSTTNPKSSSSSSSSSFNTNNNIIHKQQQHHHQQQQQQQQPFESPQIQPCDIKSLFECPICFDYAVPPIYQCQNGHLVCQSCSNKITHCPTCRVPISEPSIRNLQLDRLANTFQFPCKYNFNGCQWKSYWFKKREHEDNCDYVSYSCPCPGTVCKWTGLLSQVMPHLSEQHKSITTLIGEDIVFLATDINLKGAVDWVMIQSCFNHHFLLVLEKQELKTGQQQFFAVVQLIGSQKEAEKFKYKLELTTSSGNSGNILGQVKRLQWEATPRSILDGIQAAISTYDCLVFDAKLAQHFLSPNIQKDKESKGSNEASQGENLGINVTIERLVQ